MLNILRKHWFNILSWLLMLTYLGVSPFLYVRFILKNGKPIQFAEKIPVPSTQILFSVDNLDPITYEGEELQNLWGWAYLSEVSDQSQYDRLIVLQSTSATYFFPMESFKRPDLQKAFPQLNADIQDSGFTTYISKDVIRSGIYQIGFVFKQRSGNSIYYNVAPNKKIVRTANQFTLEIIGPKPIDKTVGKPVQFSQKLPAVTDKIQFSVDRLDPIVTDVQGLYNLWGWSFLTGDSNQSKYDRLIVLQSATNTYFFPIQSLERPDLQKAFPSLTFDIRNSGFSTYISRDVLQSGIYLIGIVFKNQSGKAVYYIVTNKIIVRTATELQLEVANANP